MRSASRFRGFVWHHLLQVRGRLLLAGLCALGFTLTGLLVPWPLKIIFDHILLDKPVPPSLAVLDWLLGLGKVSALMAVSLAIIPIAILRGAFSYLQVAVTARIGHEVVYALRRELFAHLQRLSLAFHNRTRCGELLTKITSDTGALREAFAESLVTLVTDVLALVGMFAIMFYLNWKLSLAVLATFPLLFYALLYRFRKITVSAKRQRQKEGRIASQLTEVLASVALVQAFARERYEEERFQTQSTQVLSESIGTARMEAAAARAVDVISAGGLWVVILVGSLQVLGGGMTPGDVLIFAAYVSTMYKPIRHLVKLSAKFSKAMVSASRVAEILDVEPDVRDAPDAIEAVNLKGEIVFDRVGFDYGDGKEVLQNVSFVIAPGQRVALMGASGAGKSTVVSLLLRLYDPQAGSIAIDGVDIRHYRRESLRRQIGVVLQDSVLFGTTIRENIAYGKPEATMDEIVAAARTANAHDFIAELEQGYDTVIAERGATLSGGQRQRIAIARALIRDSAILILDEPMTGLDAGSEAKVREALDRLMAGRTCLLITHDLQAVAEADFVLFLDDGRIVERGRHSELIARCPQYRHLQELKGRTPEGSGR